MNPGPSPSPSPNPDPGPNPNPNPNLNPNPNPNQINRGNVFLAVSGAGARCIRRRAELSVAMNPACPSESAAARAVQDAWEHCFKDRAPFPQALENPPSFG